MKKILFLLLFIPLFIPFSKVEAFYCSYSEQAELKNIASHVDYAYSYTETEETVYFTVFLTNIFNEIYLYDTYFSRTVNTTGNNVISYSGYNSGQTVQFQVFGNTGNCIGELITTISIKLPYYNKYYNDEICSEASEYSLCGKWAYHGMSKSEFYDSVNNYKKKTEIVEEVPEVEEVIDTLLIQIIKILLEYYYVILIIVIVASTITIIVKNKKDNIYK